MRRSLGLVCALAGAGLAAGIAAADPVSLSTAEPISLDATGAVGVPRGSFDLVTTLNTFSLMDLFALRITDGDPFENPGVVFDPATSDEWSQFYASDALFPDTIAAAGSSDAGSFPLTFKLSGDIADTILFELAVFHDGEDDPDRIERYEWSGSRLLFRGSVGSATGWSPTRGEFDAVVIPLPSTAGLAAVGVAACCIRRRRNA